MKHYYIPFDLTLNINYLYLIGLYDIAEYNIQDSCFNTIKYNSLKEIAEYLNISYNTLNNLLNNADYRLFFSIDKKQKTITLNNNFNNKKGNKQPFVMLNEKEVETIRRYKDNLLFKYYLYIKYFCGYSKRKQDFTAKQFLDYCGYSSKSNNYLNKIASFNAILCESGLIKIRKYRDELGHTRNEYLTTTL